MNVLSAVWGVGRLSPASATGPGVPGPGLALPRITAKSVSSFCGGDLLIMPLLAEAVISRPGPHEPMEGLPNPAEDNRSAERGT